MNLDFEDNRSTGVSRRLKCVDVQYSSGSRNVVALLSPSVMTQNFTPVLSR